MKVYDILTPYNYSQKSCVVAVNMATAETLFKKEYPDTEILRIEKYSDYVIVERE